MQKEKIFPFQPTKVMFCSLWKGGFKLWYSNYFCCAPVSLLLPGWMHHSPHISGSWSDWTVNILLDKTYTHYTCSHLKQWICANEPRYPSVLAILLE